ncbi:hypothetical protein, variant [Aphanomyces invadans]|nr:hypothetical protein, variant [Aphanomyces invadans]ETV95846.1 hypothetical protein, variant [Aphanomyces invadans]|eukprot:XP_008875596.1 hypothetical protein, variant [Aphanomyces invadans]
MSQDGVVAHTRTRATIEQAAAFFYLDTAAKAEQFARVMDELVEAKRTLYTLVDRPVVDDGVNKPLDYISVDWMMIKFKKGVPARDLCYLEIHKEFKFACPLTGVTRRGWVRCIHSVRMDCCPDMQKKYGVIRMEIQRSGHVFMESNEPGVLDYYKLYFGSPRGAILGKHFNNLYLKGAMRTSARAILNLDEHFTTERLKPLLSTPLPDEKVESKTCSGCHARFSWRTTKRLCRACGVAICLKCSSLWSLTLQGSAVKVPLCAPCVGSNLDADIECSKITYDVVNSSRASYEDVSNYGETCHGEFGVPSSPSSASVTVRWTPSDSGPLSSHRSYDGHMVIQNQSESMHSASGSADVALSDLMCSIDQQKYLLNKLQVGLAARARGY